jgi:oligopeptidase B
VVSQHCLHGCGAAERSYYDLATGHLADLTQTLYDETERRIPPADDSVRWRRGDCFYYTRAVAGSEHEQFLSSRDQAAEAIVILDEAELGQKLADGGGFIEIGLREVSPDGTLLAYSVDVAGDEIYALRFRRIRPGRDAGLADDLDEVVERTYYGGAWSADPTTFFYTVPDQLNRPHHSGATASAHRSPTTCSSSPRTTSATR